MADLVVDSAIPESAVQPIFYRLPFELILQIFSIVDAPVPLSHISCWLRQAILEMSQLWTSIYVSHPSHDTALSSFLDRSRECLLSIDLSLDAHTAEDIPRIVDMVLPHFQRIERFILRCSNRNNYSKTLYPEILAPSLKYLSLALQAADYDAADSPFPNFCFICPKLEYLHYDGPHTTRLIGTTNTTSAVEEVSLVTYSSVTTWQARNITDFIRHHSHSLVTLTLHHFPRYFDADSMVLERLENIHLFDNAAGVLRYIQAPHIKMFHASVDPIHSSVASEFLTKHASSLEILHIATADQVQTTFGTGGPFIFLFPRLRELLVSGPVELSPFARSVRTLEILGIWSHQQNAWTDILPLLQLNCQSLQSLHLDTRGGDIDGDNAISFPHLQTLALVGIGAASFLGWVNSESMPRLKEMKATLMQGHHELSAYPTRQTLGDLFLPTLQQLDIPYFPHILRAISAPNLQVFRLRLSPTSDFGEGFHQTFSTFFEKCGKNLIELHSGRITMPPVGNIEPVLLPKLCALYQSFTACHTPNFAIVSPSLDHLILQGRNVDDLQKNRLHVTPYLTNVRTLTIFHPDQQLPRILWAFDNVEIMRVVVGNSDLFCRDQNGQPGVSFADVMAGKDGATEILCPRLKHLRICFVLEPRISLFRDLQRFIAARIDSHYAVPLACLTLEFPDYDDACVSDMSYEGCLKHRVFEPEWLSATEWRWLSDHVPNFHCNLRDIRKASWVTGTPIIEMCPPM